MYLLTLVIELCMSPRLRVLNARIDILHEHLSTANLTTVDRAHLSMYMAQCMRERYHLLEHVQ